MESVAAPRNYDEFFRQYRKYIETLVVRLGVAYSNREDAASAIMLKLYEHDILSQFDPQRLGWKNRPAQFKTWISAMVVLYTRGIRERTATRAARELFWVDLPLSTVGVDSESTWGSTQPDPTDYIAAIDDVLAEGQLVLQLRACLSALERPATRVDFVDLFDAAVSQSRHNGHYSVADLSNDFGVSKSSIRSWMSWITLSLRPELETLR